MWHIFLHKFMFNYISTNYDTKKWPRKPEARNDYFQHRSNSPWVNYDALMIYICFLQKHLMETWGEGDAQSTEDQRWCWGESFFLGPLNLLIMQSQSALLNMISCLPAPPLIVSCSDPSLYSISSGCIRTCIQSCPLVTSDCQGLSVCIQALNSVTVLFYLLVHVHACMYTRVSMYTFCMHSYIPMSSSTGLILEWLY